MDRRTLKFLAGAIAVLMGLVAYQGIKGSRLPEPVKLKAETVSTGYTKTEQELAAANQALDRALAEDPDLFGPDAPAWRGQLETASRALEAEKGNLERMNQLVAANKSSATGQIDIIAGGLAAVQRSVRPSANEVTEALDQLRGIKRDAASYVNALESDYRAIQDWTGGGLETTVRQAIADWPEKRVDLEQRWQFVPETKQRATEAYRSTEVARAAVQAGQADGGQLRAIANARQELAGQLTALQGSETKLPELVDQLYWSADKLLVDMEVVEGYEVGFKHQYRWIKTRALAPEGAPAEQQTTNVSRTVDKATYEKMKNNLGMTVAHKAAGKYDHEAEEIVQPPGYAYMAQPGQRNRYGYWDRRDGRDFWVFYGQYSLMRNVFWPRNYTVGPTDYYGYHGAYRSGQTYYGRDNQGQPRFGSTTAAAKTKYGSSKYVKSGGYSNTNYVKSGGKYRGTRYASSSSSSYRSSSRSGSRSSGGK